MRQLLVFAVACLALVAAPVGASPTGAELRLKLSGVEYIVPPGWTKEDSPDGEAVFLLSPESDAGIEASISIEVSANELKLLPWNVVERFVTNRSAKAINFTEINRRQGAIATKHQFYEVTYSHEFRGRTRIDQYIVVPMARDSVLTIITSSPSDLYSRGKIEFENFTQKLKVVR